MNAGYSVERWRPIPGWEGLYEASDQGRVRSLDRKEWICNRGRAWCWRKRKGKVLKGTRTREGYERVALSKDGVIHAMNVHRLVWAAFNGWPPDDLLVLHGASKSENGMADNRLTNLSLGTPQKNSGPDRIRDGTDHRGSRHPCAKLTEAEVGQIKVEIKTGARTKELAKRFQVSVSTIQAIKSGQNWGWLEC